MTVDGRLFSQTEALTEASRGPSAVLQTIEGVLRSLAGIESATSIGVACAGQIAPETGVVAYAANLGWRRTSFAIERARLGHWAGVPGTAALSLQGGPR